VDTCLARVDRCIEILREIMLIRNQGKEADPSSDEQLIELPKKKEDA
jgi:hypothetical protein